MEILSKPTQKLSLSNTYNKLHQTLWSQKQKNTYLQKQNTILKSKIKFTNQNLHHKPYPEECQQKKLQLKKIYEAIKNQQEWLIKTQKMIEEKNYEKLIKKRNFIQKNLSKYNKKAKILQKKLLFLQNRLEKQQLINNPSFQPTNTSQPLKPYIITQQAVLQQLQNQNKQLYQLLSYKQNKLSSQTYEVKKINKQILQLLELKSYLRKYNTQNCNKQKQLSISHKEQSSTSSNFKYNRPKFTQNLQNIHNNQNKFTPKINSMPRPYTSGHPTAGINFKQNTINKPKLTLN